MGDFNLVGVVKVMPADPEVNLNELEAKLKEALPKKFGLARVEREPIAFGLVALKFYVLAKDEEGYDFDQVLEAFRQVENVESAEVETVSRI
ncbi:elongation factor 1-beta [Thermococcus zilligii]|uniref:elongation factor 1-beta n=1 Tax=Thermococcus zilligii TaxID=54076 RepID=UPI00029A9266|nr:elongation factor 1-beta [Thermococcus zilligii]